MCTLNDNLLFFVASCAGSSCASSWTSLSILDLSSDEEESTRGAQTRNIEGVRIREQIRALLLNKTVSQAPTGHQLK
jgi:hypothetical protein